MYFGHLNFIILTTVFTFPNPNVLKSSKIIMIPG